jgi:DNA polymerase gamma 1
MDVEQTQKLGVILPQVVPMGTVTRRATDATWVTATNASFNSIGSEVKSRITAPNGYCFVGADVDSQELWISSLLGDKQFWIHGATAFGFMTLQGSKANGTDLHSVSGKLANISRNQAKVFNYSRIYGAGQKFAQSLLIQNNPQLDVNNARKSIAELYKKTKGIRLRNLDSSKTQYLGLWSEGSESFMFNELERIVKNDDSRTPVLNCMIPNSLVKGFYIMTL